MEVTGKFDHKRFFETLAMLLSQKEGVQITVKVKKESDEQEKDRKSA